MVSLTTHRMSGECSPDVLRALIRGQETTQGMSPDHFSGVRRPLTGPTETTLLSQGKCSKCLNFSVFKPSSAGTGAKRQLCARTLLSTLNPPLFRPPLAILGAEMGAGLAMVREAHPLVVPLKGLPRIAQRDEPDERHLGERPAVIEGGPGGASGADGVQPVEGVALVFDAGDFFGGGVLAGVRLHERFGQEMTTGRAVRAAAAPSVAADKKPTG